MPVTDMAGDLGGLEAIGRLSGEVVRERFD